MRRLLIPAAAAAVAAVTLAACGGSSGGTATTSSSTTSSTGGATAAAASVATGNPSSPVTLTEAGSTLIYPFLQAIAPGLHSAYPNITLQPGPGGSGKGISDALSGTTTLGGSDAYLPPADLSGGQGLLNIPVVVSAQNVDYNLKGVAGLKLNGPVLAQMYQGKITNWNDPAIAKLNPGVTLPHEKVVPVRRVDGSGDTFIFTSYLSDTDSTWKSGPGFGTTVTWPAVGNELTANGNPGMVQTCSTTPGCVAYVGVSVAQSATAAGLGTAELQNAAGKFVSLTQQTVTAAAQAGAGNIPANLAQPLINEPGADSYPIVNFEYLIVKAKQGSAAQAEAVRTFLTWTMSPSGGSQSQYLDKVHFVALPDSVKPAIDKEIATITG